MKTINDLILDWANDKGLVKYENRHAQTVKLMEECGELASAVLKQKHEEAIDAIGDIQVVLIILCAQLGIDYTMALDIAYAQIADRKGKTINGTFIKNDQ